MNAPVSSTWIGRDVLRVATNETRFVRNITKKDGSDFTVAATKVGDTVGVRLPQRFVTNKGAAFVGQGIADQVVMVTITDQANIGWGWSSSEGIFNIQDVRERFVNPAASQMANTWDKDALGRLYQDVYNNEGTPGTVPVTNAVYTGGRARLTNFATPADSRVMVVNALMGAGISGANLALFGPRASIDGAWKEGMLAGEALGWKQWWEDVNVFPHVYGTYTVAGVVDGASQTGASILTKTWTTGVLKKGDTFTIAGVFAVNPQSYQNTTQLQQFVVTNDISDTAGAMTIPISPSIITSGAYQTVTASPADNAVITFLGGATGATSPQGLGFHKQAFVMASADPIMPKQGVAKVVRKDGVSLRIWEASDIMTDQHPTRLDSWYGFKTLRAEWATRINS
jgi:hypothetical protein